MLDDIKIQKTLMQLLCFLVPLFLSNLFGEGQVGPVKKEPKPRVSQRNPRKPSSSQAGGTPNTRNASHPQGTGLEAARNKERT